MDLSHFFSYIRKNDPKFYRILILLSTALVLLVFALILLDIFRYDLVKQNLDGFSVVSARVKQAEDIKSSLQQYKTTLEKMELKTPKDVDEIQNYLFQRAGLAKVQIERAAVSPGSSGNVAVYEMRITGDWVGIMNFLSTAFSDKYLLNITDISMEVDAKGRLNTVIHYRIYFTEGGGV
jgi:hypothetical protein